MIGLARSPALLVQASTEPRRREAQALLDQVAAIDPAEDVVLDLGQYTVYRELMRVVMKAVALDPLDRWAALGE
ncbi:hypothetical protein ACFVH6_08490 [Spirillospora sp. NPDC127200]